MRSASFIAAVRMTDLTAVSLFAGVGGFDLALQRAGVRVTAAVEIDPKARAVLAYHFPDTALFSDVQEVTGDELRTTGFIPERGIITGGFPCQDLSVAGRREGLAGARSGLFWEIVRLLDDLAPRWLVLENVPGLLSSNDGRDMGTVLGALGDLGYGWAYRVLDAQHFGVPQRRRRVFIVGHFGDGGGRAAQVLLEPESVRGDSSQGFPAGQDTSRTLEIGLGNGASHRVGNFELWDFPDGDRAPALAARRAHDTLAYPSLHRMQAFGQYANDGTASTVKARDHKDATDLVVSGE